MSFLTNMHTNDVQNNHISTCGDGLLKLNKLLSDKSKTLKTDNEDSSYDWNEIVENPQFLIDMLFNFRLTKEEEKGDITGIFSTRSLNARYFKSDIAKSKADNISSSSVIKRGTVLIIKGVPQSIYIVLTVFKKAGKKYFQKNGENAQWPYKKGNEREFKFQLAEIVRNSKSDIWRIRQCCYVVDGCNVRKTYKMILLEDIEKVVTYVAY